MTKLQDQLKFLIEIDKLKGIRRQALIKSDSNRRENSAEHSWHIAMAASILQEYAPQHVDILTVINMLLIHDMVEIDAGDKFAYDSDSEQEEQAKNELIAAKRIFALLPESQATHFLNLWLTFEAAETQEAQFAKAIDRVLPLLQNMENNGGSWIGHNLKKEQVLARNTILAEIAPPLWDYVQEQVNIAVSKGWLSE